MQLGSTLFFILGFYVISFPLGYCFMHLKETRKIILLPFFVRLPIYLAVGLAGIMILMIILGSLLFKMAIVVIVFLFSWSCYLFVIVRKFLKYRKNASIPYSLNWNANVVPFLLFLVVIFYFIRIVDYLDWPPPGDPLLHGIYISRILYYQKVPVSGYPLGFHTLCAIISLIFGIFPGESMLVVAAAITALIPCVLYSVTYTKTKSRIFSLIPYLAGFVVYPHLLTLWIMGYFYNGSYPFLAGLLFMLAFIEIICLSDGSRNSAMVPSRFLFLLLIITAALFFTYQVFLFFIAIYLISTLIVQRKLVFTGIKSRWRRLAPKKFQTITFTGLGIIFLILIAKIAFSDYFNLLWHLLGSGSWRLVYYGANIDYLYSNINGILILLAFATIPASLFKRRNEEFQIDLLFLCTFIPIVFALGTNLLRQYLSVLLPENLIIVITKYLALILPGRTIIFLVAFSWIIFARFLHLASTYVASNNISKIKIKYLRNFTRWYSIVVIYLLLLHSLIPSLDSHFSGSLAQYHGWYSQEITFPYDFDAAKWIAKNIPSQDLILNDLSFISLFLPSFTVINVVFARKPWEQRAIECKAFWMTLNFTLLYNLIIKYEIKYIFSASEWGYFYSIDWEGDEIYTYRPFPVFSYAHALDKCPFLKVHFARYATRVYEVII